MIKSSNRLRKKKLLPDVQVDDSFDAYKIYDVIYKLYVHICIHIYIYTSFVNDQFIQYGKQD